MDKKASRIRRSRRTRAKIAELGVNRLSVHRTPRHTYAQVFSSETGNVVASASTLNTEVKSLIKYPGNVDAAAAVGKVIAERAKSLGDKVYISFQILSCPGAGDTNGRS